MTQPVQLTDIQFSGPDREKLRRLVEDLRRTVAALNSVIAENEELKARVAVLEAGP